MTPFTISTVTNRDVYTDLHMAIYAGPAAQRAAFAAIMWMLIVGAYLASIYTTLDQGGIATTLKLAFNPATPDVLTTSCAVIAIASLIAYRIANPRSRADALYKKHWKGGPELRETLTFADDALTIERQDMTALVRRAQIVDSFENARLFVVFLLGLHTVVVPKAELTPAEISNVRDWVSDAAPTERAAARPR